MEKQLVEWGYWGGLASAAIAILIRLLGAAGVALPLPGNITHMSFVKGAVLFLLISVASANLAWAKKA